MRQYLLGWSIKAVSIVAKLCFLLIAMNELPEGVFAGYFMLCTFSIALSRLLSASSEEQIPVLLSQGRLIVSDGVCFAAFFAAFGFCLLSSLFPLLSGVVWVFLFLAFAVAFSVIVGGLLRVERPALYECISNLPHVVFLLLYFVFSPLSVFGLSLLVSISYFLVSLGVFVFYSVFLNFEWSSFGFDKVCGFALALVKSWRSWLMKVVSNILVLLSLRYCVAIFYVMGWSGVDQIALALSIGEVFWQFVMIVVNRRLSFFFGGKVPLDVAARATINSILFVPLYGFLFVCLSYFFWVFIGFLGFSDVLIRLDIYILLAAIFTCICFSGFSFFRVFEFYCEGVAEGGKNYISVQLLVILLGCVFVFVFRDVVWVALFLGGFFNVFLPFSFMSYYARRLRSL